VVDDDVVILEYLDKLLTNLGHSVHTFVETRPGALWRDEETPTEILFGGLFRELGFRLLAEISSATFRPAGERVGLREEAPKASKASSGIWLVTSEA